MERALTLVLLCALSALGQMQLPDVHSVSVTAQNETTLTLQWDAVGDGSITYNYNLTQDNGKSELINGTEPVVTHTVSSLSPGTKYSFTLFTVSGENQSEGYNFSAETTIPPNVDDVWVVNRTETEITLQWTKVNNNNDYTYELQYRENKTDPPKTISTDSLEGHKVDNLNSGTEYSFTLFTVLQDVKSSGYNFSNVTVPPNVGNVSVVNRTETEITLQWTKVNNNNNNYTYELEYREKETKNRKTISTDSLEGHKVVNLNSGTEYSFTLFTVLQDVRSSGYNFSSVTVPPNVDNVSVVDQTETEIKLQWTKVNNNNNYTYELQYWEKETENQTTISTESLEGHKVVNLNSGTEYSFTLFTVFQDVRSSGYNFSSVTVPLNVGNVSVVSRTETEIKLQWTKVNNNNDYTYELQYWEKETENQTTISTDSLEGHKVVNLNSGTEYSFTLFTVLQGVRSSGYNFSSVTVPSNVKNVTVVKHNDTDVTLQWNTGNKTYSYSLYYFNEATLKNVTITAEGNEVTYHLSGLIPATNYSFTLYTEFSDVRSTGFNFSHTTTLSDVTEVRVTRSQTRLTIKWNKLNDNDIYNYTLREDHGKETHFTGHLQDSEITHEYPALTPGTVYNFTLFTGVNDVRSKGYGFKSITTVNCASFPWKVTNSSIEAPVFGSTHVTATRTSNADVKNVTVENNKVNLRDLHPGETYNVSLWYVLELKSLFQCSHDLTLEPNSVLDLSCKHISGGYGLAVSWKLPLGVVDMVQVNIDGQNFSRRSNESQALEVKSLQVAKWYKVTAISFSGGRRSSRDINCQTDPAGVIAGVLVFFLLVIIICAAIFIWLRCGSAKRNKSSKPRVQSKPTNKTYKPIPVDRFPEHFQRMSCDENRGFSEEYENLSSEGVDQSKVTALLPENKDKNRFSNVLPYDSSRVHLSVNDEFDSDYINANYMPGYGNASKQYIAAQGPLPSTVNDFWRMVWEKRSQAIVMVTNCTESGRVKCEQYWPPDLLPCLYGSLVVTIKSEDKAQSWTLREFNIKNKSTSETRTVRHFHFTAWPDHGVPVGTRELIQFRGLIRQHMESCNSAGPTVVHCSAGVGRTGTLIALDVLLQQLDREKAVGIAALVQQMRHCRPLMVQTESQYVFLHQCIMDSLQPKFVDNSEPLYENTDMIYVNAIALRHYENGSKI